MFKPATLLLASSCLIPVLVSPAQAQSATSPLRLDADVKGQYIAQDNRDLGTDTAEFASSRIAEARLRLTYDIMSDLTFYGEVKGLNSWGSLSGEDDTGRATSASDYIELRQSWLKFSKLGGVEPLALQVGRQRIKENYGFWWNRDIDAVRLSWTTTLLKGFVAVAENLAAYRSDESDFSESEEERGRLMGEVVRMIDANHTLEGRFLYEKDHSGTGEIGDIFNANDRDSEDAELLWAGVRTTGKYEFGTGGIESMKYRVDGVVVAGQTKTISSAAIGGTENRRITGINERDVLGWGLDMGTDMTLASLGGSVLSLGYAFGSGDDGNGPDTAFRQTDIQGNAGRQGLSTTTMHNYGEVFRPELSNMHVLKAGLTVPVLDSSDVAFFYYAYALDNKDQGVRYSNITANTNGTDSYLGQELDMVVSYNVDQEFKDSYTLPDTDIKFSVGAFKAGSAYGDAEGEVAFRGLVDFRVRF